MRYIQGLETTEAKIQQAIKTILAGTCKRVDVTSNIKVYECKDVIRVDYKISTPEEEESWQK